MIKTTKTADEIRNLTLMDYINEANIDMGGTASKTGQTIGVDTGSSLKNNVSNDPETKESPRVSVADKIGTGKRPENNSAGYILSKSGKKVYMDSDTLRRHENGEKIKDYTISTDGKTFKKVPKQKFDQIINDDNDNNAVKKIKTKVEKAADISRRIYRDTVSDPFNAGSKAVVGESETNELNRIRELAGIVSETTSSGSIASVPSIVGNTSKSHLPTDKLRVKNKKKKKDDKIKKDRIKRKKRREEKEKLRKR